MARVLVTEDYLEDIGDAIRGKLDVETTYKPSEMATAIESIETYPEPTGNKSITANGTGIDVKDYATADVNVPNSYSQSDEGKVVSNGALVAQTSQNITINGTYDTTLKNEVVVNVSGGGGGNNKLWILNPDVADSMYNLNSTSRSADRMAYASFVSRIKNYSTGTSYVHNLCGYGDYGGTSNGAHIYRSGFEVGGIKFGVKIPAGVYQKIYVTCKASQYGTGWRQFYLALCSSLAIASDGIPSNVIKQIYFASQDKTSAWINSQSGVVINSTSPYGLNYQTVEIDVSDINQDFYIGIMNCDISMWIRSIYLQ